MISVKKALAAHMARGAKTAHPDKSLKKAAGFKAGGITSVDAKNYGRNMARVMNQRSKTK